MSDPLAAPSAPAPPISPIPSPPSATPPVLPPQSDVRDQLPIAAPPSLKPLLNPLQSTEPPPASTIVEPPRSPNDENGATDDRGRNVDMSAPSSGPGSAVGAGGPLGVGSNGFWKTSAAEASPAEPVSQPVEDQPPLPIDAPVPPSPPPPKDEAPPILPPGLIPSAVPTPTVILTEDEAMNGGQPNGGVIEPAATPVNGLEPAAINTSVPSPTTAEPLINAVSPIPPVPASVPTPEPAALAPAPSFPLPSQPSPVPAPQIPEPTAPAVNADAMDLDADAVGEDEEPSSRRAVDEALGGLEGSPAASLKRPGEELAGPGEKRPREEAIAPGQAPASTASTSEPAPPPSAPAAAPVQPQAGAPVAFVPAIYAPPPARPSGPTTPLTQNQHKHLLNAVRTLKKSKDAINFLNPVDTVLFNIPHYNTIVTRPMDLGTVETKLIVSNPRGPPKDKSKMGNWDTSRGSYQNVSEVVQDVRQIWENTRMFNGPDHVVSQMATRLEATFEKALAALPAEPTFSTPQASPAAFAAPAPPSAGPSTTAQARRPSISRPPAPRRSSDGLDRPKREIHPPPSKELSYANEQTRKTRRNDAQINYLAKQIRMFEAKNADLTGPFLYPIEEIINAVPDYTTVIKNPIDLNHIKARIQAAEYDDAQQLNADFKLMCSNAMKFNPPGHEVHATAQRFLKVWDEKWKALPPKEVPVSRSYSEDLPVADAAEEEEDDLEDDPVVVMLRNQIAGIEAQIEDFKAKQRKSRPPKPSQPKKSKPAAAARKQSVSHAKVSPGLNGNGHHSAPAPKKPRKSRDVNYDEGAFGDESEEEVTNITLTQKQELAEKITHADGATLQRAIEIIAKSTGLDGTNEEIELDIESLPSRTVVQLYNLVCRGRTPKKNTTSRPKSASGMIPGKKPGRKPGKKHLNEQEEAARIKRMEAQLQSFDSRGNVAGMGAEDSESSEEEESEEE